MKYHQRDIVEVNFLFPDGTYKPHPAIIISNDVIQEDEEGLLYLVLISSNDKINPQYSYALTDEMLVGHSFAKPSLVKCQIIEIKFSHSLPPSLRMLCRFSCHIL